MGESTRRARRVRPLPPQPDGKPYRSWIRRKREAAGYKVQGEFADLLGIEPSWYSRVESGQALAKPGDLDRLVTFLECSPRDLYEAPFLRAIEHARRTTPTQV